MKKILCGFLALAVIFVAGCSKKASTDDSTPQQVAIETATVMQGNLESVTEFTSTTAPSTQVPIVGAQGIITAVHTQTGEQVNKGDVLYTLDSAQIDAQISGYNSSISMLNSQISQLESSTAPLSQSRTLIAQSLEGAIQGQAALEASYTQTEATIRTQRVAPLQAQKTALENQIAQNEATLVSHKSDLKDKAATLNAATATGTPISFTSAQFTYSVDNLLTSELSSMVSGYKAAYPARIEPFEMSSMVNDIITIAQNRESLNAQALSMESSISSLYSQPIYDSSLTAIQNQINSAKSSVTELQSKQDAIDSQISTVTSQIGALQGEIQGLELQVSAANAQKDAYTVTAPISGTVNNFNLVAGGSNASTTSMPPTIVNINNIYVVLNMTAGNTSLVTQDSKVSVMVEEYSDTALEGTVVAVSPAPDMQTRLFPVTIEIENPGDKIKAGLVAKVSVPAQNVDNSLYVPSSSIVMDDDGSFYVYVIENNIAKKTKIVPGIETADGNTQIITGVALDTVVAKNNVESLTDNAPVSVINQTDNTDNTDNQEEAQKEQQ